MVNATWYVTATGKKGEQKILTSFPESNGSRASTESVAKAYCKREGLTFEQILPVRGTTYNGSTQSKTLFKNIAAERAKNLRK
jgi:hypothetical protein